MTYRKLTILLGSCFTMCVLAISPVSAQEKTATKEAVQDKKSDGKKKAKKVIPTKDVEIGGYKFKIPETWTKEKSSSSMRLATYSVKPVKGETDKAEMTFFKFGSQPIQGNIDRWVGQFNSEGRKSKSKKGKCPSGDYYFVEISGTYKKPKPGSPPFARQTINAENYRMLGVLLPVGNSVYVVKLAGPDKTVAAQAKAFRKSFGGNKKKESAIEE